MKYQLIRSKDTKGLLIPEAHLITELKIWYSSINDWEILSKFQNLVSLEIAGYDSDSLEPISKLIGLKTLRLLHFPKLQDISKITCNINIENLSLESLPSYDASNKYLEIDSLKPVSSLSKMMKFKMYGVKTKDSSLEFLVKCTKLIDIEIGKGFNLSEYNKIRSAFPGSRLIFPK